MWDFVEKCTIKTFQFQAGIQGLTIVR